MLLPFLQNIYCAMNLELAKQSVDEFESKLIDSSSLYKEAVELKEEALANELLAKENLRKTDVSLLCAASRKYNEAVQLTKDFVRKEFEAKLELERIEKDLKIATARLQWFMNREEKRSNNTKK